MELLCLWHLAHFQNPLEMGRVHVPYAEVFLVEETLHVNASKNPYLLAIFYFYCIPLKCHWVLVYSSSIYSVLKEINWAVA